MLKPSVRWWRMAGAVFVAGVLVGCLQLRGPAPAAAVQVVEPLDTIGAEFVRLALALGEHDADYVDAYHGPAEWRESARSRVLSLGQINRRAGSLMSKLALVNVRELESPDQHRHRFLGGQLRALAARAAIVEGREFSFDAESRALYDVVAPVHGEAHFGSLRSQLEPLLPGTGSLDERLTRFRADFVIAPELLDMVFRLAIDECARRTAQYIPLPDNEQFTIEYVTGKAWSGYNWYQGNSESLIQVNTDLPIHIDRAVDLACHEGYPGHHVYSTLIEQELVNKRGWIEFSLFPLFSPQGPIAEGSANFGIELAFPGETRQQWEREVLFPAAGLDASRVDEYYRVEALVRRLNYAGNEAARGLINGTMSDTAAQHWLMAYALMSSDKATQRVAFIRKYRSYVVNYNVGKDLVADYVNALADSSEARRWEIFQQLLIQPALPSDLVIR